VTADVDRGLRALLASDAGALADPYPLYRELRARSPVHDLGSVVVLARYDDVKAAARDTTALSSRVFASDRAEEALAGMSEEGRRAHAAVAAYDASIVSHSDGEQHARLRRIAHRAFTPRRIAEMRQAVEGYTDELLEQAAGRDVSDMKVLAYRLPLMVIADMLGVPAADRARIHEWSGAIGRSRGVVDAAALIDAEQALADFGSYVRDLAGELRRASDRSSLVAALLDAEEDERMSPDELTATFVFLLFAGHETTTNLIATGLLDLLLQREQWQRLCGDPAAVAPAAVEELLRYASPVQLIQRVAAHDVEFGGVRIPAGRHVIGLLGSANRDPDAFERPDELDLARAGGPGHLDFGFGPHFCLGASLARLEGQVAFTTLARRFPGMELAADPDELSWGGNAMLRSLETLPIRLGAPA
jgi:cytochrome P450